MPVWEWEEIQKVLLGEEVTMATLPEWIENLKIACDDHLTEPWDRDYAADLWIEKGRDLITKIEQLQADNARLRAALEPFAEYARRTDSARGKMLPNYNDKTPIRCMIFERHIYGISPTLGDCRRAAGAIEKS